MVANVINLDCNIKFFDFLSEEQDGVRRHFFFCKRKVTENRLPFDILIPLIYLRKTKMTYP